MKFFCAFTFALLLPRNKAMGAKVATAKILVVLIVATLTYILRIPASLRYGQQWRIEETKASRTEFQSNAKFFFVVGLEGSGHHFLRTLGKLSPALQKMKDSRVVADLDPLQKLLMDFDNPEGSLFNAHCSNNATDVDFDRIQQRIVAHMKSIEQKTQEAIYVPLNVFPGLMLSYPTFLGPCRSLNHPSLSLMQQVCQRARVDCGHVYIYRDPLSVLKSTTINRHYNRNLLKAMHLYTAQLNIIASQLRANAPSWGCYGLLDTNSKHEWIDDVASLLGFDPEQFLKVIDKNYQTPASPNASMVSAQWIPHLQEMQQAHNQTLESCQETLQKL